MKLILLTVLSLVGVFAVPYVATVTSLFGKVVSAMAF